MHVRAAKALFYVITHKVYWPQIDYDGVGVNSERPVENTQLKLRDINPAVTIISFLRRIFSCIIFDAASGRAFIIVANMSVLRTLKGLAFLFN